MNKINILSIIFKINIINFKNNYSNLKYQNI